MGRQISLYMLPEDEYEFLDVAAGRLGAQVLLERSESDSPSRAQSLPPQGSPEARLGVVLWCPNTCVLPAMKQLDNCSYIIDKTNSEVIEFSRSELINGKLQRGRLWYDHDWWDIEFRAHPKRAEFQIWAKELLGVARRQCRKMSDGLYIGRHADEWVSGGGSTG